VTRLILVRHAEPADDARGRCYGRLDVGLSAAGLEHARRLPASLSPLDYDAVYTSPRVRARQTAEPLASARGLSPVIDDELRELDFGELEGRRYEEIEASEPELYRAWMETPTRVRFPGGESYADLRVRGLRALERIRARHDAALVVTHGGIIRAALADWLGMPDEAIFRLDQSYCGTSVVEWLDGVPIVRLLNYTAVR
jgi:alpha-ribazole phosphatase